MRFASLFLAVVSFLFVQATASAQYTTLAGSAEALRGSLRDLASAVDKKVDRDHGGQRIKDTIERARDHLDRVQSLAERGAPKDALAESVQRARDNSFAALDQVRGIRSDSVQQFAGDVSARLRRLDNAYADYGYAARGHGYDRGGTVYVPVPIPVPRRH